MGDPVPNRPASFPGWTVCLAAVITLMNVGLFVGGPAADMLPRLELDPRAVLAGQPWRVMTANFVHWGREHFLLDVGAFLTLGWLSEPYFRRSYPLLLLCVALGVGLSGMWFLEDRTNLRGLSGVNSGQFAALLWIEIGLAIRERRRWIWAAPATAFFLVWIGHGAMTGRGLLMSSGQNVAGWAHLVGAGLAVVWLLIRAQLRPVDDVTALAVRKQESG